MLYMIIEHFGANTDAIRERFETRGRLMPEGVAYQGSWIDSGGRCFQVMESPSRSLLDQWIHAWNDLVRFEVIEVQTSADFWAGRRRPG